MDREKRILFGMLAAQLKGIKPAALREACAPWKTDPNLSIPQSLLDAGLVTAEDRTRLETLVDEAVQAHGGDAQAALAAFGGIELAERLFGVGLDTAALDAMKTAPMNHIALFPSPETMPSGVEEAPGRYTVVSQHAKGGMGRVLLVHDEFLGRSVALKELLPVGAPGGTAQPPTPVRQTVSLVSRFLQEARITGQLEHPSIVPVYELGRRQDGTFYYTMKLVRGKTLAQALRDCASMRERLALLPQIIDLCQAIAYAHSRGVIHRDIKPSNVMVGQFGETIVLDWGLAKVRDAEDIYVADIENTRQFLDIDENAAALPETAYGRALGTPHYMSPEQAEGRVEAISERSDVYSLGAVLFELLTGATPFTGKNTKEILDQVIHAQPASVLAIAPDAPPPLAEICQKALRHNPAERYGSAIELAEDIQRFITGSLVKAYRYNLRETLAFHYRKHRAAVHVAAASLVVLAVIAATSYAGIVRARNQEHAQRLAAEAAQRRERIAREDAERLGYVSQLTLIQEYLHHRQHVPAFAAAAQIPPSQRNWVWGLLMNHVRPELTAIETGRKNAISATLRPDGTLLAVTLDDGIIQFHDAATGALLYESPSPAIAPAAPPRFSPDGAHLVSAGTDTYIRVWDTASGQLLHTLAGHTQRATYADFSPDGARIVSAGLDGAVRLWDTAQGTPLPVPGHLSGLPPLAKACFSPDGAVLAAVSAEGGVTLWDTKELSEVYRDTGRDIAFAPGRPWCALCTGTNLLLWDYTTREPHKILSAERTVMKARFSQDARKILALCMDGTTWLFETDSNAPARTFVQDGVVDDAFFARDDTILVTCGRDGRCVAHDIQTGCVLNHMMGNGPALSSADIARDGRILATAANEPLIQLWDPLYRPGRRLISYGPMPCLDLSVAERAGLVAAVRQDAIQLSALNGAGVAKTFPLVRGWGGGCRAVLSDNGGRMAATLDTARVSLWDLKTGEVMLLGDHLSTVMALAFDPDAQRVAAALTDGRIIAWDVATGAVRGILQAHTGPVFNIEFSPDGRRLLSASADTTAAVWETATGTPVLLLQGHKGPVRDAVFDRLGLFVYTASEDGTLRAWSAETGAELGCWEVRSGPTETLGVDHENKILMACGADGIVQLRDLQSGDCLGQYPRLGPALCLPNSAGLLVAQQDGRIEHWMPAPWRPESGAVYNAAALSTHLAGYHGADYAQAGQTPLPEPTPSLLFALRSARLISPLLTHWAETLDRGANDGQPGFPLDTLNGDLAGSLLGLALGDRLTGMEDQPRMTAAQAAKQLRDILAAIETGARTALTLHVSRNDRPIQVRVHVCPDETLIHQAKVPRNDALTLIQALSRGIADHEANKQWLCSASHEHALLNAGMGIGMSLAKDCVGLIARLGMGSNDRLMRIDNKEVLDYDNAHDLLLQIEEDIDKGKASFSLDVQHGEFVRIRLDIAIAAP